MMTECDLRVNNIRIRDFTFALNIYSVGLLDKLFQKHLMKLLLFMKFWSHKKNLKCSYYVFDTAYSWQGYPTEGILLQDEICGHISPYIFDFNSYLNFQSVPCPIDVAFVNSHDYVNF